MGGIILEVASKAASPVAVSLENPRSRDLSGIWGSAYGS